MDNKFKEISKPNKEYRFFRMEKTMNTRAKLVERPPLYQAALEVAEPTKAPEIPDKMVLRRY